MRPALLATLALATLIPVATAAQEATPDGLERAAIERRAVEAVIWGMPAVNYDLMLQEMLNKTEGEVNQVVYWREPLTWKNQTLTPNPDTLYFMAFFDLTDGPVVLEIPPAEGGSLNGNIVTTWQVPIEDVGLHGADQGKGGKFVLLPPDYADPVPEGFTALQSETFGGYMLFRSTLASHDEAEVERARAYAMQVEVYPLAEADNPPPTVYTDAWDVLYDSTIRYDASFFESLNRIVQSEPWLNRDRLMIDQLASLGIRKGQPFQPDAETKAILDTAAQEAKGWLEAHYDAFYPGFFIQEGQWSFPVPSELVQALQNGYSDTDAYPVDLRGITFTFAYVAIKRLGAGQFYLVSIRDVDGEAFDGSQTYQLTVPPGAPVEQYWSVTAYDRETHALIRDMPHASRSSQIADLQENADGSVDIYFGPEAPDGKEANWVPTDPERGFELMFRLYGPSKAFFDKAWVLPDVEKVN